MSLVFRKKSVKKTKTPRGTNITIQGRAAPRNPMPNAPHRSVKYVEIYGSLSSISADLTKDLIEYEVPDGHCAELYALGVMPDYDPATETSNLLDITLATNDVDMGLKFLCNHIGMNSLPYGDRASKQPIRLLDYPMRRGNLTPKFNEGVEIEIKATAGDSDVSDTVRARAKILLYEPADVSANYGVGINNFASLPGGIDQTLPKRIFADYALLESATEGKSRWNDLYSLSVKDYEEITLTHIGIKPHAYADSGKLYDHRLKWEAPEYEPYWKINEVYNALPFGDDDDYQPTQKLPSIVAQHVYTNTTLKFQIRDNGTAIPADGLAIQLFGVYRRVR